MLYAFAFDRLGVVISDIYFEDPRPGKGQEGPEQGARLELRLVDRLPLQGSIYSAQPIGIDRPIWRADLLESVDNPGSFDRTHHHPTFRGWEPSKRTFVEELSSDPLTWMEQRLSSPASILEEAGVGKDELGESDLDDLARAAPEIVATLGSVLDRVRAGELARPPAEPQPEGSRISWL